MRLALLIVTIAGLGLLLIVFSSGDTRISESPVEVAESRAIRTIEEGGADPEDWIVEGACVAMGPCQVDLRSPELPDTVLATDGYTVKDSRATVNGPENIGAVIERAVGRDCLERFGGRELRSCLTAEAEIPAAPPGR